MKNGHFDDCQNPTNCWCEIKRYSFVFVLTGVIFTVEIIGGIISGSLALFADAGHVFTDGAAVFISIITAYLVRKRKQQEDLIRSRSGIINALLLFGIAIWVGAEGLERVDHPHEIVSETMMIVAFLGTIGNGAQLKLLGTLNEKHITHKAMSLHILSDLFQSFAVVIGGLAIYITGINVIDPVLSIGIALWMAWQSWELGWYVLYIRKKEDPLVHYHHHHH